MKSSILLFFIALTGLGALGQTIEKPCGTDGEVFWISEQPPRFGACDDYELTKDYHYKCSDQNIEDFLKKALDSIEIPSKVSGTVVISAIVEKSGCLNHIKLGRDVGFGYGERVQQVIAAMPDWTPGKQNGQTVRVRVSIPVEMD